MIIYNLYKFLFYFFYIIIDYIKDLKGSSFIKNIGNTTIILMSFFQILNFEIICSYYNYKYFLKFKMPFFITFFIIFLTINFLIFHRKEKIILLLQECNNLPIINKTFGFSFSIIYIVLTLFYFFK